MGAADRDLAVPEPAPVAIHGHRASFLTAGEHDGRPVILLVHGLAGDKHTWDPVLARLGQHAYVVAPDLPGHGEAEEAGGDCSIPGYAAYLRDLLRVLDISHVTVVGHSLGGGVAMQMTYLFPELVARLVLVDAGGLGSEVSPILRAATLPGAELVLPVISSSPVRAVAQWTGRILSAIGAPPRPGVAELARGVGMLAHPLARKSFLRTVRTSLSLRGQAVDARDRLYLTSLLPTLVVWGARDAIIPVSHGVAMHEAAPGSELEILEQAGHFPHLDEPGRFVRLLASFVDRTSPAAITDADVVRLLSTG
jgi:pimeloyl-ACP methyl ester carboxylesterase